MLCKSMHLSTITKRRPLDSFILSISVKLEGHFVLYFVSQFRLLIVRL